MQLDPDTRRLQRLAVHLTIVAGGLLLAGSITETPWLGWVGVGMLCGAVGVWVGTA